MGCKLPSLRAQDHTGSFPLFHFKQQSSLSRSVSVAYLPHSSTCHVLQASRGFVLILMLDGILETCRRKYRSQVYPQCSLLYSQHRVLPTYMRDFRLWLSMGSAIPLLCRPIPPIISWLFGSIPERLRYYKGRTRCLPAGPSSSAEKKAPAEVVSYPKKGPYVPKRIIYFYAVMPTSSLSVEKSQVCLYLVCAVDLSTLNTLSFIQLKVSLLCFS